MVTWSAPITRRRFASPTFDAAGRWSRGSWTESTIYGTAQAAPGETTSTGPDGKRAPARIDIFAPIGSLRAADQLAGTVADRVYAFGAWYEVEAVAEHPAPGFSTRHERIAAQRVDEADQSPGTAPVIP